MSVEDGQNEHQPVWKTINSLESHSKLRRVPRDSSKCEIIGGTESYFIEPVQNDQQGILSEVHKLLINTFSPDEVEPKDSLIRKVEGKTISGTPAEYKHKVYTIKNKDGELLGAFVGAHLDLRGVDQKPTGETMLARGYTVVKENFRKYGFARELYLSALIDSAIEAEKQNKQLVLAVSEAVSTAEKPWNKFGLKRIYTQIGNSKKEYQEVPYLQPPFDTDEISQGTGGVPEHMMVQRFGFVILTKERIIQAVRSFYREHYMQPPEMFKDMEVYFKHLEYIVQMEKDFEQFLLGHGKLIFLDANNREKATLRSTPPLIIHEYTAADKD